MHLGKLQLMQKQARQTALLAAGSKGRLFLMRLSFFFTPALGRLDEAKQRLQPDQWVPLLQNAHAPSAPATSADDGDKGTDGDGPAVAPPGHDYVTGYAPPCASAEQGKVSDSGVESQANMDCWQGRWPCGADDQTSAHFFFFGRRCCC